MTNRAGHVEPPPAHPVRRGRRMGVALLVILLAAGTGVHFWHARRDEQRLAAMLGAIRARGEPLTPREFRTLSPPAGENAAGSYRQAVAAWAEAFGQRRSSSAAAGGGEQLGATRPVPDRRGELLELLGEGLAMHRGMRQTHGQEVRELLGRAREAISHCRRARACPAVDWGLEYDGPAFRWGLAELEDLWGIWGVLLLAAGSACDDGDVRQSLEHLRDAAALAWAVGAVPRFFEFAEADRMRERLCLIVEEVAPRLSGPGAAAARPAAEGLIADLLADDGFERALLAERAVLLDILERLRTGAMRLDEGLLTHRRDRGLGRLVRALRLGGEVTVGVADEVHVLEEMGEFLAAARATSFPQALAALQRAWENPRTAPPRSLSSMFLPEAGRTYKLRFRNLAFRRMAASSLAIRLYELDGGGLPGDLAVLVPKYLPAVPVDPFAADGRAVACRPRADPPRLMSVFDDGRDQGGDFVVGPSGYVDLIDSPDLVFFLDGDRPQPPAGRRAGRGERAPPSDR